MVEFEQNKPWNSIGINSQIRTKIGQVVRPILYQKMMQQSICKLHQKPTNVIDLDLGQVICERCALFDPLHAAHNFIEAEFLEQHSRGLYQQFEDQLKALKIVHKQNEPHWQVIQQMVEQSLSQKIKAVNTTYDRIISVIEEQRKQQICKITNQISTISSQYNQTVTTLTKVKYQLLLRKQNGLQQLIARQKYLDIERQLYNSRDSAIIASIGKQLEIIRIDLAQKLKQVQYTPTQQLGLAKKKTSYQQQLLLNGQEENEFLDFNLSFSKTDHITCSSNCKTQNSFLELPSSDLLSSFNEPLNRIHLSNEPSQKRTKVILHKSEIKNMHIRNDVRTVQLVKLSLSNREALEALKKCSSCSFVSKVDLSHNELSSQLVSMVKRQKALSKYLKTIVVKGIKIDQKTLAKQGISAQNGRIVLGDVTLQF